VNVIPQQHSLRHLFHALVDDCYGRQLGLDDTEISTYVADLLTDFSESNRIYAMRDAAGKPLQRVSEMLTASDPVHGTAPSFDAEREARKHIGNYALFFTGMYPRSQPENFLNLIETGKESFYIVSSFNLFEYAREAPMFERLADKFETCVHGINLVRSELDKLHAFPISESKPQQRLM
jgi:hypothetical protein